MSLVSIVFILSQVTAIYTTNVGSLWIVSTLLGLAYGGLFGLAPIVCLEWFGLCECSLTSTTPRSQTYEEFPLLSQPTSPSTGVSSR